MWTELKGKQLCVWDIEADGLLDEVTKVHCLWGSIVDGKSLGFRDPVRFLKYLDGQEVIIGHNILGYDLPALEKLYGWKPKPHVIIIDTLVMSRMFKPDIEGGHSLKAWGHRMGNYKGDFDGPWHTWTPEMHRYCAQDTNVNKQVFLYLAKHMANYTFRSLICEMRTAQIINRQMDHGFVFKYTEAEMLHAKFLERVGELEDEVHRTFKPIAKMVKEVQPKIKMDGTVSSVGLKSLGDGWADWIPQPEHTRHEEPKPNGSVVKTVEYHSGSYTLIEWPEFSLGSRQQIASRLQRAGYKLTKKTEKGNFIIDDVVLQEAADAGIPEAKPLAEYFLIQKREAMVKDWLAKARWHEDQGVYRIHGYVNTLGAATNRMTHSSPNVAQVPSASSPYGHECRSLFTVRSGYRLVGCDADGLELRCLAHYMNNKEYTEAILHGKKEDGTDIHSVNMRNAGLADRDTAKTFIYAFLYGAGDAKIGAIVGGGSKDGKALKAKFLSATPALRSVREGIADTMSRRLWLKGIDGRILRVRSAHSALNTLLQGMGAIVMKYWLIEVTEQADAAGLDWNPSANVHDEGQFEVKEEDVPAFEKICEDAFLTVSNDLELRCPCTGTADSGDNWSQTH